MDLEGLKKLLAEATPGPWVGVPADDYAIEAAAYPPDYPGRFPEDDTGFYLAIFGNHPADYGEANRDLAVAAVNALPALIERVERLEDLLGQFVSELTDYGRNPDRMLHIDHDALSELVKQSRSVLSSTSSPDNGGA